MLSKKPNILLIYTGGTIGMVRNGQSGALAAFDFSELLNHIPEIKLLDCTIETFSFEKPIDSSNMNPEKWVQIAQVIEEKYSDFDGFVVLHGSDTMAYSASALSFMLENLQKPVIFTGSQLPIGQLRTDAKENLITSIEIALMQENNVPVVQEVALYFEYKLYRGNRATKINADFFNAFASPNYPFLVESGVNINVDDNSLLKPKSNESLIVRKKMDDNVVILKLFPGINKQTIESIINIPHLRGIILETYGSGNAMTEDWFVEQLQNAINKGLHIVNVTQCAGGRVSMGNYETSTQLKKIGIISGKDITTEAAVTKMMYLLGENIDDKNFKDLFETALRGEME
jgi:L-asparaginase